MRAHVFIVNNDTFPIHLQYLFAGTGAKSKDKDIRLLADIKRVRADDLVIFYIEGTTKTKGGFYGIFKIASQTPLVFHTPGENGLKPNLNKKLIYRTLIAPYEIYSDGLPEWEALDKLPVYATEIQWSLIYRKLKGKRGCTPLLPWEAERLINMIRDKNCGKIIADEKFSGGFDWDINNRKIKTTAVRKKYPYPRNFNLDIINEILELHNLNRSYEPYLQLYFTENIGSDNNLNPIIGDNVIWFGNEVACGVGMQKIDILTICEKNGKKEYRIIELKDEPVSPSVTEQLEYYVNWASQNCGRHLLDAYSWNIQPVVVAPPHPRNKSEVFSAFKRYNNKNISLPILYFEFNFKCGESITFQKISY